VSHLPADATGSAASGHAITWNGPCYTLWDLRSLRPRNHNQSLRVEAQLDKPAVPVFRVEEYWRDGI
jgi:hypothetical protein